MKAKSAQGNFPLIFALCCTAYFVGCEVGPNYKRPGLNVPENFRSTPWPNEPNSFAELAWWDIYNDDTLKDLIREALVNNYDLRVAVTRVEQARALSTQASSQFYPEINYEGVAARGKNSFSGNPIPSGARGGATNNVPTQNSLEGLLTAAWEMDLWGRIRRLDEAAFAEFLASEDARRGVQITLISDVATTYFELLELDNELEIARRTTKSFEDSLKVFTQRFEGGIASDLETSRAKAALASTAATIPNLESRIIAKENQINILLGRNPGPIFRKTTLLEETMPVEVPAGLPSELLERRPDIRQAEQLLRSANAQIGVAIGDFLPRFTLTGLYGGVSTKLSNITENPQNTWSIGIDIAGPIFQGGRLKGQYLQVMAAWEQAKLQYKQTALNAFGEVSDILILKQKLQEIHDQQTIAVEAYRQSVDVSMQRYIAGKASYYEVLEAQQLLFPAENALAQTHFNLLTVVVQLYKSLGGGWKIEETYAGNKSEPPDYKGKSSN